MELISTQVATEMGEMAEHLRQITVQVRGSQTGSGAGTIWSSDGWIITNAHVVRGEAAAVELADGRSFQARVMARDEQRDLVALAINAEGLSAATVGEMAGLRVGEIVLAMGHPLGTVGALSQGILHQGLTDPTDYWGWVQADIRLAPGNSGGPLVNARGQVIGINSLIVDGRAFAIPSHAVDQFLRNAGSRPYLGVTLQPILVALQGKRRLGLLVLDREANSPAEMANLGLGDILLGVNGQPFYHPQDLTRLLNAFTAGETVQLEVIQGGRYRTLTAIAQPRIVERKAA